MNTNVVVEGTEETYSVHDIYKSYGDPSYILHLERKKHDRFLENLKSEYHSKRTYHDTPSSYRVYYDLRKQRDLSNNFKIQYFDETTQTWTDPPAEDGVRTLLYTFEPSGIDEKWYELHDYVYIRYLYNTNPKKLTDNISKIENDLITLRSRGYPHSQEVRIKLTILLFKKEQNLIDKKEYEKQLDAMFNNVYDYYAQKLERGCKMKCWWEELDGRKDVIRYFSDGKTIESEAIAMYEIYIDEIAQINDKRFLPILYKFKKEVNEFRKEFLKCSCFCSGLRYTPYQCVITNIDDIIAYIQSEGSGKVKYVCSAKHISSGLAWK